MPQQLKLTELVFEPSTRGSDSGKDVLNCAAYSEKLGGILNLRFKRVHNKDSNQEDPFHKSCEIVDINVICRDFPYPITIDAAEEQQTLRRDKLLAAYAHPMEAALLEAMPKKTYHSSSINSNKEVAERKLKELSDSLQLEMAPVQNHRLIGNGLCCTTNFISDSEIGQYGLLSKLLKNEYISTTQYQELFDALNPSRGHVTDEIKSWIMEPGNEQLQTIRPTGRTMAEKYATRKMVAGDIGLSS